MFLDASAPLSGHGGFAEAPTQVVQRFEQPSAFLAA
jgi:hypothetical protein